MRETKSINIQMSIEVMDEEVIANMLFTNSLHERIYLDKWTIGLNNILTRNIFSIVDKENKHILYSGMAAYRIIEAEDFILLNPGESIKTKITVNKDYKLIKGQKYFIRFCANNPTYPGIETRLELWSNKFEFVY